MGRTHVLATYQRLYQHICKYKSHKMFCCRNVIWFYITYSSAITWEPQGPSSAALSKNAVSAFQIPCKLLSFGRFLKKLADDQCSSLTKGSIFHIKNMYIQPSTTVVDWPEMWHLMKVSAMFYICRYCTFTWWGRATVTSKEMPIRNYFKGS